VLPFVRPDLIKIETIKHAREAVAAGATIGQGFLFGHPAPLPSAMPPPGEAIPLRNAPPTGNPATPWEVVASSREPRRATKDLLVEMCMQLEHQGLDSAEPNLLLACFQEADHPAGEDIQRRYDVVVTHDRELVIRAAEPLLRRLVPPH